MKFRILLMTVVLGAFLGSAVAAPGPWPGYRPMYSQQQVVRDPNALVQEGLGKLTSFMRQSPPAGPEAIAEFLEQEIAPYFDFAYMTRWVAGRYYRYMGEEQRTAMEAQLEHLFLGALAQRLGGYQTQGVRYYPTRPARGNEVDVAVGIVQPGTYPAKLNFRFYRGDDGWKVFDVSANGSSALVFYRQYFSQALRQQRPRAW